MCLFTQIPMIFLYSQDFPRIFPYYSHDFPTFPWFSLSSKRSKQRPFSEVINCPHWIQINGLSEKKATLLLPRNNHENLKNDIKQWFSPWFSPWFRVEITVNLWTIKPCEALFVFSHYNLPESTRNGWDLPRLKTRIPYLVMVRGYGSNDRSNDQWHKKQVDQSKT